MTSILLFDLDGTLIDSRADLTTGINLTRADYGLPPLSLEEVVGMVGDGVKKLLNRAFADATFDYDLEELIKQNRCHYHDHLLDETVAYPGVKETLEILRKDYRLGVVTNKPDTTTRRILDSLELLPLFDSIVGGGRTEHLKPDAEPLLLAMSEAGAVAEGSWMIGDHRTDLGAALNAGLKGCFCTYGFGVRDGLHADAVIDTFPQLLAVLQKA